MNCDAATPAAPVGIDMPAVDDGAALRFRRCCWAAMPASGEGGVAPPRGPESERAAVDERRKVGASQSLLAVRHSERKALTDALHESQDADAVSLDPCDSSEIERRLPRALICDERLGAFAHMCFDDERLGSGTTMLYHPRGH